MPCWVAFSVGFCVIKYLEGYVFLPEVGGTCSSSKTPYTRPYEGPSYSQTLSALVAISSKSRSPSLPVSLHCMGNGDVSAIRSQTPSSDALAYSIG